MEAVLDKFVVDPEICVLTYSCVSVEFKAAGDANFGDTASDIGCGDFENTSLQDPNNVEQYLIVNQATGGYYSGGAKTYKPGEYQVTIKGAINGVTETAQTAKTVTYIFTLTDPCDPPTSLTFTPSSDFSYKITDTAVNTPIPTFTITPNYCLYDVTTDIGTLNIESSKTPTSYDDGNK